MNSKTLRKRLVKLIEDLDAGKATPEEARAIVSAASQINNSIIAELKFQHVSLQMNRKVPAFGMMQISGGNT